MSKTTDNTTKAQWEDLAQEALADSGYWKAECRKAQGQRDTLLAALRDMIRAVDIHILNLGESDYWNYAGKRLIRDARAAIAAAEGSAS